MSVTQASPIKWDGHYETLTCFQRIHTCHPNKPMSLILYIAWHVAYICNDRTHMLESIYFRHENPEYVHSMISLNKSSYLRDFTVHSICIGNWRKNKRYFILVKIVTLAFILPTLNYRHSATLGGHMSKLKKSWPCLKALHCEGIWVRRGKALYILEHNAGSERSASHSCHFSHRNFASRSKQ
jgi:hypothetical protein